MAYSFHSTGEEVAADLSAQIQGKIILVTGVSPGGLGAEFAVTISKHSPALLILANRNIERANDTAKKINVVSPGVSTRVLKLDLGSQRQVREAAAEVNGYEEKINVLVNNAGIMAGPHTTSPDGIEHQFATNHIGHFLFTNLIMKKLTSEDGSWNGRVVNVSSNGYRLGPVRFGDWNFDNGKTYDQWLAYGQSKTANMLFSISLASKLAMKGLVSVSLHPGAIPTNLFGPMGENGVATLMATDRAQGHSQYWLDDFSSIYKSIAQGISTHVYAAFHDSIPKYNGRYFDDCHVVPTEEIYCWGRDPIDAEKLWKLSERIVGECFET